MREGSDRKMAGGIKLRKCHIIVFAVTFIITCNLIFHWLHTCHMTISMTTKEKNRNYKVWPLFEIKSNQYSYEWFKKSCLKSDSDLSMEELYIIIQKWKTSNDQKCRNLYNTYSSIFTISENPSSLVIPDTFAVKVKKWLGNNEALFQTMNKQKILFIYNEYTREENVFNALREKRPMSKPERPEREYVNELSKNTSKTCDFCQYQKFTAKDIFGRVESKYSFTASNTFKLDHWHTLILLKEHHPLDWKHDQFMDLMNTAKTWLKKAYNLDKSYKYPMFVWDLLPHAGASQVHPHVHAFLDVGRYQGAVENWRVAADEYTTDFPDRNYFTDFISTHMALGLTAEFGKAVAVATLVPKRDNEVVIISETANEDFFNMLFFVYRAFIDDMEKLCYSSGIAFPSMDVKEMNGRIPAYARILTRGAVADIRTDISSLELFTAPNANTDPYKVIQHIQKSIQKRAFV